MGGFDSKHNQSWGDNEAQCPALTAGRSLSGSTWDFRPLLTECVPCCKLAKSEKANVTSTAGTARGTNCWSRGFYERHSAALLKGKHQTEMRGGGDFSPSNAGCVGLPWAVWTSQRERSLQTGVLSSFLCTTYTASEPGRWPVCRPRAGSADAEQGKEERERSKWLPSGDPKWSGYKG